MVEDLENKILLVDPLLRTRFEGLYDDFDKEYDIPYGLLAIGSYLKEKSGISPKIISMDFETQKTDRSDKEVLESLLQENDPRIVAFSAYTMQFEDVLRLARTVKEYDPDIRVVIGGHHAMHQPDSVLKTGLFDAVIVGEGEELFKEYVDAVFDIVPDHELIESPVIMRNKPRFRLEAESLPHPDYSLLPRALVENANVEIMTSRGCPYNCAFCSSEAQYGRIVKTRDLKSVEDEIRTLVKDYGHARIGILDETLHARKDFDEFMGLLRRLHEELGVTYMAQTRADLVLRDPASLDQMAKAGIEFLVLGAESASDKVLKSMNKRSSYKNIPKALKMIKDAGIGTGTFWIVGHPGSSYEDEMQTKKAITYLLENGLSDYTEVNIFVPYNGAASSKDPRITNIDKDLSRFNRSEEPVFDLEGFSRDKIKQAYFEIMTVVNQYQ